MIILRRKLISICLTSVSNRSTIKTNRCGPFLKNTKINQVNNSASNSISATLIAASLFSWKYFEKSESKDIPENELIITIKRSILAINTGDLKKAEVMLHLALKMAQDLQNKDGITYIYDIMANLAMETSDFEKAERLFADVMKRLFADGVDQENIKILHISAKIAHMAHLQDHLEKATEGFLWTINKMESKMEKGPVDADFNELCALIKNWYAQLLMDKHLYLDAKKYLLEAYEIYTNIHGTIAHEGILMLNNLGVICINLEDNQSAVKFFKTAIEYSKSLPEWIEVTTFQANLGLVYLKQGFLAEGKEICSLAWRLSKNKGYKDGKEQAEYCLEQAKL